MKQPCKKCGGKMWIKRAPDAFPDFCECKVAADFRASLPAGKPEIRTVAALLRLGFLASATRKNLFATVGIPDVYVLAHRPSFTGNGKTDGADYAWCVWGPGLGGRVQRLEYRG